MEQKQDDPMMRLLTAFLALRQGGGESTIQEHEQISARTRAGLPLAHAGLVSLAFLSVVAGVGLFTGGVFWLLDWDTEPGQMLLAFIAFLAMGVAVYGLVRYVLRISYGMGQVFVVLFLVAFASVAILSAAASTRVEFSAWEMGKMALGAALLLGGVTLGYNQALSLVDPYWRQSPFERAIMKMLPELFGMPAQGAVATGQRTLVVHVQDGNRTQILYADILGVDDDQLVGWAQKVNEGRGLAESRWVGGGGVFDGINQYRSFRTKLEGAGMMRNTVKGYELTGSGRALVRRLVEFGQDGQEDAAPSWWGDPKFDDRPHTRTPDRTLICAEDE